MSFPIGALNAQLEKLAKHPFYEGRVPSSVADAEDFAANVPLMSRTELVTEMNKTGYGAFGGGNPVRINLSPMGSSLIPVMQTSSDLDYLITVSYTHLRAHET